MQERSNAQEAEPVSIAVENVDEAVKFYRDVLGLEVTRTVTLDDRQPQDCLHQDRRDGARAARAAEPGQYRPALSRSLGPGLHHICFEVDDVAGSMER